MTKYIADRFIDEFNKQGIAVDCFRIETVDMQNITYFCYDALGIFYPVHALNAPEIVIKSAKLLPKSDGKNTFIIHTAGEDNKVNYASSDLLIKLLTGKGYNVFYNRLIEMPSNLIVKYDEAKVAGILSAANEDIPNIAGEIIKLTPYFMKESVFAKVLAFAGRAEWLGARILGKFFYIKSGCTRCGKCADNCPNRNIVMNEKSVSFMRRCGLCMRCIYLCPQNAVYIRRPFRFLRFEQWYDCEMFK